MTNATTTTNNTINTIQGENNTMTNTNTTNNTNKKENTTMTKSAYFTKDRQVINNKKVVVFNEANLANINNHSIVIGQAMAARGVTVRPFFGMIGANNSHLIVDGIRGKFVVVKDEKEASVQFASKLGKQIIDFLMVIIPGLFPAFTESEEFKKMSAMNLKGRLTAKAKKKGKLTRETVLMAALNMFDIYVVKAGSVVGKLMDIKTEAAKTILVETTEVDGKESYEFKNDVEFFIAKDTKIENLNSPYSLFQKMSGSLAATRFAKIRGKKMVKVNVIKDYTVNGVVEQIVEEQDALLLPEMCTFDGSATLPFGEELNAVILKEVFRKVTVVESANGSMAGEASDYEVYATYNTYVKSMSQARSNGAVGFQSLDQIVDFLIGTGSDAISYGKAVEGSTTGEMVMSVGKAYKRFMLAGSNGLAATKGLLSRFGKNPVVKEEVITREVNGNVEEVTKVTVINHRNEEISMAIVEDFESVIPEGQDFLINVLDANNALQKVEKFAHWKNQKAVDAILNRNLTDGGGYIHSRIVNELRAAGVINSFDAFQLRVSNAVKGAVIQFDEMCELYGVDIVLTKGMVKSEVISNDIRENGFQLFVVGQRKDGADGIWIASQALQQMGLTTKELAQGVNNSIEFTTKAVEENIVENLLTMLNAADEEDVNELAAIDFVRLAGEFGEIADEQYIKDEMVSLAVKKLNKLLDSKLFTEQARTRYMFSDPIAVYNAAKEARHTVAAEDAVLNPYEVVCPAIVNGEHTMLTGKALSVRFPVTVSHEIPVVTAVAHPLYKKYVEQGIWQGCTFFDIFSWVVAQQAGADHDGDTSIMIFDPLFVNARIRMEEKLFGGTEVLPFIDAYVKYNEEGEAVEFGTGCPTYVVPGTKKKENEEKAINGFKVVGTDVFYKASDFEGENGEARRRDFMEVVAKLSNEITLDTIESSLIGLIANRAMVLTDLLSRSVLKTDAEREYMEEQLLLLTTAGRWEIDRPKHGGAYLEMPVINELFANFETMYFNKDEMNLSDTEKFNKMVEAKGLFHHLFVKVERKGKIAGYKVEKPEWLASQKDEKGEVRKDSQFQMIFNYAKDSLAATCETLKKKHSANTATNNIVVTVEDNMEVDAATMQVVKAEVFKLYNAFNAKEMARRNAEAVFMEQAVAVLVEEGKFGKKDVSSMTKAKKKSKVRDVFPAEMANFKNGRELHEGQLRKAMYQVAKALNVDVRVMVGALYLVINEQKTNGKAAVTRDGREFRFVASNGNIALPFETFKDEMSALVSGKISETYFVPTDLAFTLVKSNLIEEEAAATASSAVKTQVNASVLAPNEKLAGKTVNINRNVRIAVKFEEIRGEMRKVVYVLNKDAQVNDVESVTREHAAFVAFAPENMMVGLGQVTVATIKYHETKQTAVITFA